MRADSPQYIKRRDSEQRDRDAHADDHQPAIDPDSVEDDAEVSTPLESGMGMPIIRAIVDELVVEQGPGGQGTVVRMVKSLDSAA